MSYVWAPESLFVTPTSVTATQEAASFGVRNLWTVDSHPYLHTWRSTAVATNNIVFDFGAPVASAGVAIFNTNASQIYIQEDDNSGFSSPTNIGSSPYTIGQQYQYRNFCVLANSTERYKRVGMLNTNPPVGGASYFEIGLIVWFSSYYTLPKNPLTDAPLRFLREYEQSGNVKYPLTPIRVAQEWEFRTPIASVAQLLAMAQAGEHRAIVVFENSGDASKTQLVRLTAPIAFTRNGKFYGAQVQLEEYV